MNKVQRLALAGAVAPSLRRAAPEAKSRRIALTDKDGNVTGYTTLAEVQKKLLLEREIEIAVQDDVRPREVMCQFCGKSIEVRRSGSIPTTCRGGCEREVSCAGGCGQLAPRSAFIKRIVQRRKGAPWRCLPCGTRAQSRTPEQRSEHAKSARAKRRHWPGPRAA